MLNTGNKMEHLPALEISGLSLSLGGNDILKNISSVVPKGAFVSIVGPNGAGKSSLLRCVMRVVSEWTGEIKINGKPLDYYRRKDLARLISYVPQSDEKWFPFTGRELVMMGRYPHLSPFTRPDRTDIDAVENSLEATGTASLADRDMRTLSGGERQKVLIAGALAQEAEIMLLDEPTTFLDPRFTDDILSILAGLNDSGVTVVMVTHDINHASLCADHVIALVDGQVEFAGLPSLFVNNEILQLIYGKIFTLVDHPVTGQVMVLPGGDAR